MTRFVQIVLGCVVLVGGAFVLASAGTPTRWAQSPSTRSGAQLVAELGCAACHGDIGPASAVRDRAPSLDGAGTRYRSSYLFTYLLAPSRVRPHIGAARMPGFHLDEREALALTLYLSSLEQTAPAPPVERGADVDAEEVIRNELGCLTCHTLGGTGAGAAPALDAVGARLTEEFLVRYLADPRVFDSTNVMPPLFYERSGTSWQPRVSEASAKLGAVTRYLLNRGDDVRDAAERRLDAARDEYADVTAEMGAVLGRAFNCGGCHRGLPAASAATGPPLSQSVRRLRPDWLRAFLKQPHAVRPVGYHPGDGSRMPDFRLTDSEVDSLVTYLMRDRATTAGEAAQSLTPFQRTKAQAFVVERLPCLGCHRLNGEGGRIAPDLSAVGARLTPDAIRMTVADPRSATPGSIMPRHPMPDARIDLIAGFLAAQTAADSSAAYLSPIDYHASPRPADTVSGETIYHAFCAHCHGNAGAGDGYNAPFLPVPPTRHADSAYMSGRPDDTLYDGIHAGGYILNRSHRMPAFGQRLTDMQIRALVAYMRELCSCQGPAWSRDGRVN